MACEPRPTSTRFSTSTFSTISVSTGNSQELSTSSSETVITSTRCDAFNTSVPTQCLSSTVVTSTSIVEVVTTIDHPFTTTVPVLVPQTIPVQTFYSPCDDNTTPPPEEETTPPPQSTFTTTHYVTTTDESGTHVIQTTSTGTTTPSLNNDGKKSGGSSNIGAIVGGVVGGIIGMIILVTIIWFLLKRRQQLKDIFEDTDDEDNVPDLRPTGILTREARRRSRRLDLGDDDMPNSNHYQYGMVGPSPTPSGFHSQRSSSGLGYNHRRNTSRDALMGGPGSPQHSASLQLDVLNSTGQRRVSSYSSAGGGPEVLPRNPDEIGMLPPRPSSSLDPMAGAGVAQYAPGHGGFYQQYGPLPPAPVGTNPSLPPGAAPPSLLPPGAAPPVGPNAGMVGATQYAPGELHKPTLESSLAGSTRPMPAHTPSSYDALVAAAGIEGSGTSSATGGSGTGLRPNTTSTATSMDWSDIQAAVMASGDIAAASSSATGSGTGSNVGFGRQRSEKSPRPEAGRAPVIQHQDGGGVTDSSGDVPPPAYS